MDEGTSKTNPINLGLIYFDRNPLDYFKMYDVIFKVKDQFNTKFSKL